MSKPRICKTCKWLHNRVEPCCSCSRWGRGKTDHYIPAEETLGEYLERKEREDMEKINVEDLSTAQLIDAMQHCVISGDCKLCPYWGNGRGCSFENENVDLMEEALKHLKQLQQELIDERDRYDRPVSFELAEAELLRAAKGFVGSCVDRVFFTDNANESEKISVFQLLKADCTSPEQKDTSPTAGEDTPHQSPAVTASPQGGEAFNVPSRYCDCEKSKLNEFYKNFKQQYSVEIRKGPDNVPRLPLIAVEDLDKADDTVRRCAEYVAEKHLQLDDEWPPEVGCGEYWRNICGINAKQEAKGRAKYGQSLEENTTLSTAQRIEHAQEELIDALKYLEHLKAVTGDKLTANDYQRMAMRTAGEYDTYYDQLRNAAYGLNGEAGEVIDLLKKHEFQGHDLPEDKLIDECGDVLWYCALLADALGFSLEQVMNRNIDKLRKRYPDGFDKARSINREGEQ